MEVPPSSRLLDFKEGELLKEKKTDSLNEYKNKKWSYMCIGKYFAWQQNYEKKLLFLKERNEISLAL